MRYRRLLCIVARSLSPSGTWSPGSSVSPLCATVRLFYVCDACRFVSCSRFGDGDRMCTLIDLHMFSETATHRFTTGTKTISRDPCLTLAVAREWPSGTKMSHSSVFFGSGFSMQHIAFLLFPLLCGEYWTAIHDDMICRHMWICSYPEPSNFLLTNTSVSRRDPHKTGLRTSSMHLNIRLCGCEFDTNCLLTNTSM